jgi:Spy/CpxP family protein refolding chaperone
MLGIILGTVLAIGIIKVFRRHHGWGRCGGGHYGRGPYMLGGFDGPGWDSDGWHGGHGGHGGGFGPRVFLRSLFQRLETTPGQEKAIVGALDELRENRRVIREEMRHTREDVARVVGGGLVDDGALEETFARHDRLAAQLRVAFVEALRKVSETLDEGQRKKVSRFLEGGGLPRWGNPYRGGMWA